MTIKHLEKMKSRIRCVTESNQLRQEEKSIVVAAAGNDGIDVNDKQKLKLQREYQGNGEVKDVPASMDNVVTVGSTDQKSNLSEFSNFGMNYTDIAAPGGSFAYLNQFGVDKWMNEGYMHKENILTTANNGRYIYQAGTSLATPKVSGALALIIDKYHLENIQIKRLNCYISMGHLRIINHLVDMGMVSLMCIKH